MRHKKKFNHLGRKAAHRNAMLSNMASSLILNKRITTTIAKAKALKMYVEPLITKSKNDTTHSRRIVFSYLQDKYSVSELYREVAAKIGKRPGGYTRILKLGKRLGDNADMCIIELVDYNENMLATSKPKAKTTRRHRTKKSTATAQTTAEPKVEATETAQPEAKVEETPITDTKKEVETAETQPKKEKKEDKTLKVKEEIKPEVSDKKEDKTSEEEKKAE